MISHVNSLVLDKKKPKPVTLYDNIKLYTYLYDIRCQTLFIYTTTTKNHNKIFGIDDHL